MSTTKQMISTALAGKLAALLTLGYLKERARRGKRSTFDRALAKVREEELRAMARRWAGK